MSELFGEYKRPNAEKKIIEKFVKIFQNSKVLFKNKNYLEALEGYQTAYELLTDIWDIYPKIITLYIMMKGYFYTKQYMKVKSIMETIEPMLNYIPKNKFNIFIKIKSKILIYQLILYFIYDDLDNSIDSVMGMIKYLTNQQTFTLEDKAQFFWNYIKSFLKITGITEGNKFLLLKEGYDSMIVEQVSINNDDPKNNNEYSTPVKKVNRLMVESYKSFMNSKLRGIIYEVLDKEFFYVKYHKVNDKVMMFLHKNMTIFVRDNNRGKLIEIFHTFLVLNKMNLKKEYHMTLDELVYEQKRRIEVFDRIFSNMVGAFNHIFKQYFADELPNLTKTMKRNNDKINTFKFNINELKNMIKVRIKSPSNWEDELLKGKYKKGYKINNSLIKNINHKRKEQSLDYNFSKDIKIPPNTEEMDKQILFDNYMTRKNILNSGIRPKVVKTLNNYKPIKLFITNNNKNDSFKLPNITTNKNILETDDEEEEKNFFKNIHKKKYRLKLIKKKKKNKDSELASASESLNKNVSFKLRNINNFLITKILNILLYFYNLYHNINILPDDKSEKEEVITVNIRRKDLFEFNIPNYINSYCAISKKGNQSENQDNYFYYNNFFLLKNLYIFGVLDGHGKYGKDISQLISILYPAYLFYLLLDDDCNERKVDINKTILKLIKIQESPNEIKDMFILRYFFNKLEIDFSTNPFITKNQKILFNQIYEAIYYSHNELKNRYHIDLKNSGTTLCSSIILGNLLYIINLGDSRAILGTYYSRINKWKVTQLSIDHKPNNPNESKRIIYYNGRIDKYKNEFGEEYGPYRVFGKDDFLYPGLALSRSIGDEDAKKWGVIYEPEIFNYELKENDKIIIIGTDGLWEILSNEEVIEIVGECWNKDIKCEETAEILVDTARKKFINNYKEKKEKKEKNKSKKNNLINKEENENNYDNKSKRKKGVKGDKDKDKEIKKYIDDITCIIIYLDIK